MIKLCLLFISISVLTACGLGGASIPQDHYYRLPTLDIETQTTPSFKELVIKPVKATGLYHDRAILYIEQEKPLELKRYHYNYWAETPADLLHNALYQGLNSSGISQAVNRDVMAARPDFIIDSQIVRFERVIKSGKVEVQVALNVTVRSGHDESVYWSQQYAATENVNSTAMHPSAQAFGLAVQNICTQLITDLLVKK